MRDTGAAPPPARACASHRDHDLPARGGNRGAACGRVTNARSAPRKKTAFQRSAWPLASDSHRPALPIPNWSPAATARPPANINLEHLLALHGASGFVGEGRDDLPRARVDDIAGRRIGVAAVDAEGDPAGLIAQHDAGRLLRRHHRRIEDVHARVAGSRPATVPVRRA